MSARRSHKNDSSRMDPSSGCSHTREVTPSFLARFYFSKSLPQNRCSRLRIKTSAVFGARVLRAPPRTRP